jgi:hypothetical protein
MTLTASTIAKHKKHAATQKHRMIQQGRYDKTVTVLLILLHFKYATNKLVTQKVKTF